MHYYSFFSSTLVDAYNQLVFSLFFINFTFETKLIQVTLYNNIFANFSFKQYSKFKKKKVINLIIVEMVHLVL